MALTTVLLTVGDDCCGLRHRHCSRYHHVLAAIGGRRLDRQLESGADPDTNLLLSLRATALIAPARRRRLALTLREIAGDAERSPHPFNPRVALARREILAARDLIEETAALLLASRPANPTGVAHVQVLLQDGASPLYRRAAVVALRERLEAAIEALDAPPVITADT